MKNSTRRGFIKNVAIGSAAAGIDLSAQGLFPRDARSEESRGTPQIRYRQLGSTGYKVSEIGMGCMNMRDPELVHAAIDSGINYIDTAHRYMNGQNEEVVGQVMKTKRDKVFLTTKIGGRDTESFPEMIETSLKRLQTDHVDLLLLHNIRSSDELLNNDVMKIFDDARQKGQTRFVGFSTHNFGDEISDAAIQDEFWEAVLVVYNYLSPSETAESIKKVRDGGLAVIGMKNLLKMGSRPRNESRDTARPPQQPSERPRNELNDNAQQTRQRRQGPRREPIEDIREDKTGETTPQQALLKWALNNPNVDTIIPGMTSFEQLAEDVAVMGMKLSYEDQGILRRYSESIRPHYCHGLSGCTGCEGQCPNGVKVSEINRCLGYAYGYDDERLAWENYRDLPREARIDMCSDCDECTVKCVNGLNLTENIQNARKLFA